MYTPDSGACVQSDEFILCIEGLTRYILISISELVYYVLMPTLVNF
jgi:hypothetical protein